MHQSRFCAVASRDFAMSAGSPPTKHFIDSQKIIHTRLHQPSPRRVLQPHIPLITKMKMQGAQGMSRRAAAPVLRAGGSRVMLKVSATQKKVGMRNVHTPTHPRLLTTQHAPGLAAV